MFRINVSFMLIVVFGAQCFAFDDEWAEVAPEEAITYKHLAKSALQTRWAQSEKGWCRATASGGQIALTLCWDGNRKGFRLFRDSTSKISELEIADNKENTVPLQIVVMEPKEQWFYRTDANLLTGTGGSAPQEIRIALDCRPRSFWLAWPLLPRVTHLETLLQQGDKSQVLKNSSGHVRFDSFNSTLEFDQSMELVLVEIQTKFKQYEKPEYALPMRFEYEVAKDRHGVSYCQRAVATIWPRGGEGKPKISELFKITEYDSNPPNEIMELDYKSIKVPEGTIVKSTIPGNSGQWVFGLEKEGAEAVVEQKLKNLGRELKQKGFGSSVKDKR